MKKLVFVILAGIVVLSISTGAQAFEKGTIAISPATGARITIYDDDNELEYNALEIDGEAGYFIADNIELGLALGYYDYSESGSDNDNQSSVYLAPYVDFYFPVSSNYYYIGAAIFIETEDNDTGDNYTDDITALSVEGGYKWMIAKTYRWISS